MNNKHERHSFRNISVASTTQRVVFVFALAFIAATHWYIGKWSLANMASTQADKPEFADLLIDMAPSDPQTHYAAAVLYGKTFLPVDQARSVSEYERSTALSPNNYILWLEYGKALEASGDRDRAEMAFKRCLELAPNYAAVQWALGNLLIRKGDVDAGFSYIRTAVDGNPEYAQPAVSFAYQYFGGDLARTHAVAGTSKRVNAALALLLANQKRLDDAVEVWRTVDEPASDDLTLASGQSLVGDLISDKKYGLALNVSDTLGTEQQAAPERLLNGGFEDAIKLENASPFEWQIGPGTQPQVLQSTSQVHGGQRSLVLRFNSNDGSSLRQIAQTIVVRPNTIYRLNGFYHTDLKADGKLVCQIADAATGGAVTEIPLTTAANWSPFSAVFQVPADSDAIVVRFFVKPCGSAICPVNGSVWIDDITLSLN